MAPHGVEGAAAVERLTDEVGQPWAQGPEHPRTASV
jgi:hypothetical protein